MSIGLTAAMMPIAGKQSRSRQWIWRARTGALEGILRVARIAVGAEGEAVAAASGASGHALGAAADLASSAGVARGATNTTARDATTASVEELARDVAKWPPAGILGRTAEVRGVVNAGADSVTVGKALASDKLGGDACGKDLQMKRAD